MSSHNEAITRSKKTLIVFLVDHSGSMSSAWDASFDRKGKVAQIVNTTLGTLVRQGGAGVQDYIDRLDIALIGYGSNVESAFEGDLLGADTATSLELRTRYTAKEGVAEIKFVTPHDEKGGTNMDDAIKYTIRIVEHWVSNNPTSYPPTVFHITDGEYGGVSPENNMQALKQISTSDGQTILWNMHISDFGGGEIVMPTDISEVSDPRANELCRWSSKLPESQRRFTAHKGKYAFAYNAKPDDIEDCLAIGTQAFL